MERVACIIVGCNGADKEYRLNNKRRPTLASFWPTSSCPACWRPWHCLVEMMVAIDQPGNEDEAARIEFLIEQVSRLIVGDDKFDDLAAVNYNAVGCIVIGAGPDSQWVFYPGSQKY